MVDITELQKFTNIQIWKEMERRQAAQQKVISTLIREKASLTAIIRELESEQGGKPTRRHKGPQAHLIG